jgi:Zn-dependent peptidase ImmA (M78 family)
MSDDRRVNKRYDWQVRDTASRTKDFYKVSNRRPVNIVACLQSGWILTDQGRKRLTYRVIDDTEMGGDDGKTEFIDDCVIISVKKSIHEGAVFGDGRSRMTLAHELGHGVMHKGAPKFRGAHASGATGLSSKNALESAEHQAKVFASAFLVHDKQAAELKNAEEISTEFGISLQAAKIVIEGLKREEERAKTSAHIARVNEEIQRRFSPAVTKPKFLDEPCIGCGEKTVCIVGVKLLCMCGRLTDRPQDGDQ